MPPRHKDLISYRQRIFNCYIAIKENAIRMEAFADAALAYPVPDIHMDEHIKIGFFTDEVQDACRESDNFFCRFAPDEVEE